MLFTWGMLTARRESDLALPEGLEAGLLGGLVVVVVYLVPDMLAGDWLRTPTLLGALLLYGSPVSESSLATGGLAGIYTVLHFACWAIAGFAASALFRRVERRPALRRLPAIVFAVWIVAMVAFDFWIAANAPWAAHLWIGSVVAGLAMAAYLAWRHPTVLTGAQGAGGAGTSR